MNSQLRWTLKDISSYNEKIVVNYECLTGGSVVASILLNNFQSFKKTVKYLTANKYVNIFTYLSS